MTISKSEWAIILVVCLSYLIGLIVGIRMAIHGYGIIEAVLALLIIIPGAIGRSLMIKQ